MQYVGIETQQARNNFRSVVLLFLFPILVILLTFLFSYLLNLFTQETESYSVNIWNQTMIMTKSLIPFILVGVIIWFAIAYFANVRIINSATNAKSLERKENMRVYNLVENLCMTKGMKTPKIQVIEDDSLNAFASGINERTYTVTLSRGIINKLNDEELEAVIAHELSHIRNRDVRLLIVSIVFVGIFAIIAEITIRSAFRSSSRSRSDNKGSAAAILLIAFVVAIVGYFFASLMRFAISRKREYLADAGAAEMTRNPMALASALRRISEDSCIEAVKRNDVAQLFIEHPKEKTKKNSLFSGLNGLFATHPPIKKRIEVLEQF